MFSTTKLQNKIEKCLKIRLHFIYLHCETQKQTMKEFITLLIPVLVLLLAAVILMGVRVLFVKGGKFPDSHVDGNPELRKRGIRCAHHNEGE